MEIHFKIIGVLLVVLAVIHAFFPKYFNWRAELSSLSLINREMVYVHTFFIAFILFLMGILCLTESDALIHTVLGRKICLGFGLFWTVRLLIQIFGYSPVLWKGKRLEMTVHIIFSILWTYLSYIFLAVYTC